MITYFLMYITTALFAINNRIKFSGFIYFTIVILLTLIIGLRHEVGGDWIHYLSAFERIKFENIFTIIQSKDPGYYLLNLLMYNLEFGIYGVNLVCAIFFILGLTKLAKTEINPWLVVTIAIPYTLIVVSMGYTRQAVALGFVMWAITYLRENKMISFFVFIALASSFHKTAVVMIGLGIFSSGGGKFLKLIAVTSIAYGLYEIFLASQAERLYKNYVDAQMQSSGAFIRTFMNLIPALLLVLYRKRWQQYFDDYKFWFIIAVLSIFCFAIVGMASTAVDRMALYLIPIQLVVFARLGILMSHQFNPNHVNLSVIAYYGLILFVWLNFANHAFAWVPYQNILFLGLY